jgi:hypothetical protein
MPRELLLLYIMAVFTGIAAIALVVQMLFLFGIYRSLNTLRERATALMERVGPLAEQAQETLQLIRGRSTKIFTKIEALADQSKVQLEKMDSLLSDVSETTRGQLTRLDEAMAETVERLHQTTEAVQKTVLVPVRQIRAVAAAVGAVVSSLNTRRRPTVDQATLDEEMFI